MNCHFGTGISLLGMTPATSLIKTATEPGHVEPAPQKGSPMQITTLTDDDIFIDFATQAYLLQHPLARVSAARSIYLPSTEMVLLRDGQAQDLALYRVGVTSTCAQWPLSELARLNEWERAEQFRVPTAQVISAYALGLLARLEVAGVCEAVKDVAVNYGLDDNPDRHGLLTEEEHQTSRELGVALIRFIELSAKSAARRIQESLGRYVHRDPQYVPRDLQPGDPREGLLQVPDVDNFEDQ